MINRWIAVGKVFWAAILLHVSAFSQSGYVKVQFYSATLDLPVCSEMPLQVPTKITEEFIRQAYVHFDVCEYHPFLKKVGDYRRGMTLSDWHFYEILCRASHAMFPKEPENFHVLFEWFMLRKSGIDARLFFTDDRLFLHAPSKEVEFGFYTIEQNGVRFVNLSAKRDALKLDTIVAYLPEAPPDGASMDFEMRISQFPHMFNEATIERLLLFSHKGVNYKVRIFLNRDYLRMMDDYPYYNQSHYFEIGLSPEAEQSLIPGLQAYMKEMPLVDQISFLLSFTRTAFFYQDDKNLYGGEKPMTPEQTLYHSFSDCEDRSALFYFLCKRLLGLPAIVLDFESHVGVAVEIPEVSGDYFDYQGRRFVYCEPTGPQDLLKVGEMWPKVRGQRARVITAYIP